MRSAYFFLFSISFVWNISFLYSNSFNEKNLPVIIWWTERLFPHFGTESEIKCTYGSCISSRKRHYSRKTHPITFLFYGSDFDPEILPLPRQNYHVWALFHEESPLNNYMFSHSPGISLFNFTATFSRHSNFPVTTQFIPSLEYFTERKPLPLDEKNSYRKKGLAPVMYLQSHCNIPSDRDTYVQELMKHVDVDSYGTCLHNKDLPEALNTTKTYLDNDLFDFASKYKFHIAFENAICEDYITEKLYRPLYLGAVPIYKGSPTVKDWLPSNQSAIVADDFESPEELAAFISLLDANDDLYNQYLTFKESGVTNEYLRQAVLNRNWGVDDWKKMDFIQAFECYLCDRVYNFKNFDIPSVANRKHMNCHQPHQSFLHGQTIERMPESLENWIENYWYSFDSGSAIQMMIQNRDNNTSNFYKYLLQLKFKS